MNSSENRSVTLLDLKAQFATIRDEIRVALDRVIEGQQFILGPEVEALEQEIAADEALLALARHITVLASWCFG